MTHKIEARAYGPDSTPEQKQAIKDRIFLHEPGIVCMREMPVQHVFHYSVFEERINEVIKDVLHYDLLIDLIEAAPPSAEVRERIKLFFAAQPKLRRVGIFTGKNFAVNLVAKFLLG